MTIAIGLAVFILGAAFAVDQRMRLVQSEAWGAQRILGVAVAILGLAIVAIGTLWELYTWYAGWGAL